jgi:Flp pilus assembly protein TadD
LFATTLLVFGPVTKCDFINYDDPDYFVTNPHVYSGVDVDNVFWAFTSGQTGNWHPLTWLSLMLDAEIFGPNNPTGPHLTNLVFHGLNVVLLFLFLKKLTGLDFPSAFVAGLFAWHPLHVESVAWVAERKDVLSTFFGLLGLLSYGRYAIDHRNDGIWLGTIFFALSLMSKPMLVTLPFLLVLLDWWPLGRLSFSGDKTNLKDLLQEKIPFFALSAISCIITFQVQQKAGSMATLANFSVSERIENVFVAYARYLAKTVWPNDLANPYPLVRHWESGQVIFSAVLILGFSVLAIAAVRRFPYLFIGWFWFLGTLIPVIGLVQVGIQSMADRYTYFPLIGLFIILGWGLNGMCERGHTMKLPAIVLCASVLMACAVQTKTQLAYWRNSETLFRHALAVTKENYLAENDLGTWLANNGRLAEALDCLRRAVEINPNEPEVRYNLGNTFSKLGNFDEAIQNYQISLQARPDQADVLGNLGVALVAKKQYTNAIACFMSALKLEPDSAEIHNNLATVLFIGHEFASAEEHFRDAMRINPENPQIYVNLGDTLLRENKIPEAVQCYQMALDLKPDDQTIKLKLQALLK